MSSVYHAPTAIADALALLRERAVVIGGGTLVLPLVRDDAFGDAPLVDVSAIAGFDRIGGAVLGPAVTYATLLGSPDAPPLLRRVASGITGGPQIRNQGTIGGSASYANPSSDIPTALMALEASFRLASARGGERTVPARDFFVAPFVTARRPDELLVAIELPSLEGRWGYVKIKSAESSWPIAVAAARVTSDAAVITIGAATPVPVTLPPVSRDPVAIRAAVRAARLTFWEAEFGDAAYRARLAEVVAVRAVEEAS